MRFNWRRPGAYEIGGRPALEAFLDTLHRVYDARGVLTDENGRDLLTNEDRSDLIRQRAAARRSRSSATGSAMMAPRFQTTAATGSSSSCRAPASAPGFSARTSLCDGGGHRPVLLAGALPDAPGAQIAEGRGALRPGRSHGARRVDRRDELGQLARTFDRMAERIETLLAAERRLLLDISHELRSPLARLGVAIELARSGDDPDAALNRIQKESDRLNSLVGQLLQVTRAEGDPDRCAATRCGSTSWCSNWWTIRRSRRRRTAAAAVPEARARCASMAIPNCCAAPWRT